MTVHLWLSAVVQTLQIAVGATLIGEPHLMWRQLEDSICAIPAPRTAAERLILRGLLLEFAARYARRAHRVIHSLTDPACSLDDHALVLRMFVNSTEDPSSPLLRWLRAYFLELHRTHSLSAVRRAAEILQTEFRQHLNAAALARRVPMSPSQLRRAFQGEFGMTIREYQGRLRALASFRSVLDSKSEAASLDVGYRSRKNFCGRFRKCTRLTPTAFRSLSHERRQQVEDRLRLSLLGRSRS